MSAVVVVVPRGEAVTGVAFEEGTVAFVDVGTVLRELVGLEAVERLDVTGELRL
ncbi:MAG: hypothetical protein ACYCS7_00825 [Acidimicrobiales bacterium]